MLLYFQFNHNNLCADLFNFIEMYNSLCTFRLVYVCACVCTASQASRQAARKPAMRSENYVHISQIVVVFFLSLAQHYKSTTTNKPKLDCWREKNWRATHTRARIHIRNVSIEDTDAKEERDRTTAKCVVVGGKFNTTWNDEARERERKKGNED